MIRNYISGLVCRAFCCVIGWFSKDVQNKCKRTMFLSSLNFKLYTDRLIDQNTRDHITKMLEDDVYIDTSTIGEYLGTCHWGGEHAKAIMEKVYPKETLAEQIIRQSPEWLRYNRSEMKYDVRRIVSQLHGI